MVVIMMIQNRFKRSISALLIVLLTAMLIIPTTLPANAANKRFITELRLEAGEDAVAALEADGWSVTMVGLNVSSDPASQVYLGYKMNTGSPITNVILSPDVGDSCTDKDGVSYQCVSHIDVNEGIGGGAGCLYATRDANVGAGLVGLDVLRGSSEEDVLYPITNDGAEIVRTQDGAPADLESGSGSDVVYLAQIRDGIVRPYISEIGVITDSDKWNAVYTAAERGYNYYVEGDIDEASDTYTVIGFERTADPEQAVTGITAIAASTVQALEDERIVDAAEQSDKASTAAVTISGVEYVRISSKPIEGEEPFYIYRTKDKKGGNPISMLYAERIEEKQYFLFGTWANGYFFSPGMTTAYTYSMNEDLYNTLWEDQTVLTKLPVQLVDSITTANGIVAPTVAPTVAEQPVEEAPQEVQEEVQQENQEEVQQEEVQQENQEEVQQEEVQQENQEEVQQEEVKQESQEEVQQEEVQQEEVRQENPEEVQQEVQEVPTEAPTEAEKTVKTINLTILTPRDGLSDTSANLTGMRGDPAAPYVERTERSDRVNKYQASVFSKGGIMALILGVVALFAAVSYYFFRKKSSAKEAASEESNQKNKTKKNTNKKKKPKKSR